MWGADRAALLSSPARSLPLSITRGVKQFCKGTSGFVWRLLPAGPCHCKLPFFCAISLSPFHMCWFWGEFLVVWPWFPCKLPLEPANWFHYALTCTDSPRMVPRCGLKYTWASCSASEWGAAPSWHTVPSSLMLTTGCLWRRLPSLCGKSSLEYIPGFCLSQITQSLKNSPWPCLQKHWRDLAEPLSLSLVRKALPALGFQWEKLA